MRKKILDNGGFSISEFGTYVAEFGTQIPKSGIYMPNFGIENIRLEKKFYPTIKPFLFRPVRKLNESEVA
ncbi:MAG: hypothetical protein J6W52_03925 [Bacteroidaceae bacterium]|nr:hypothetical protein [Bacteroidaceae bacterium]